MASCELCGRSGQLVGVIVEGTLLSVCDPCSKFGNVVNLNEKVKPRQKSSVIEIEKYLEEIRPEYSEEVKTAREKLSMDQKELAAKVNEKISVIQKIEAGKMRPSIPLAQKLEKVLGIKIIENLNLPVNSKFDVKNQGLTIGDLIKLKDE